jgi:hypothetical protein
VGAVRDPNQNKKMKRLILFSIAVGLAGCASPEVTVEHKGKLTILHQKSKVGETSIDKMQVMGPDGHIRQVEMRVTDSPTNPMPMPKPSPVAKSLSDQLAEAKAQQAKLKRQLVEHEDGAMQAQLKAVLADNARLKSQLQGASEGP